MKKSFTIFHSIKILLYRIIVFSALILPLSAHAEKVKSKKEDITIKFAVVNTDRIFELYKKAQEAKERFSGEVTLLKLQVDSAKSRLENEKKKFEEQKLMLSERAKTIKIEELKRREEQFNNFVKEIFGEGGKIEIKRNEIIEPITREIADKIREIAEEKNISMVFDIAKGGVLFSLPSLDITMNVVEELNSEYEELVTPQIKKKIAVLYIFPLDRAAKKENIDKTIKNYIDNVLQNKKNKVEIISSANVNNAYTQLQINQDHSLTTEESINIGRIINANLVYTGEVERKGKNIIVRINLIDITSQQNYGPKEIKVSKEEELKNAIGTAVMELFVKATE